MTHITRISRIRNCGVFRDFSWSANLPEFGRYNLTYGWNGTGKTTLSRLFRDLELRRAPTMGEVALRIDGSEVRGENFSNSNLQVRVFNRDFIQENVFPVKGADMPPIFVLGAKNVEREKKLENLKKRVATAKSKLESAQSAKSSALNESDQFCINRAVVLKEKLRSSGQSPYNNYNKSDFRNDASKMVKAGDGTAHCLTEAARDKLSARSNATTKPKVEEIFYSLPDFNLISDWLSELLETTVVSATIEALKRDPRLANWTRQGLAMHREQDAALCLFCEQPLPRYRLAALEKHFSAQYEQFIQRIDEKINELQYESRALNKLQLPAKEQLHDDFGSDFQPLKTALEQAQEATNSFLQAAVSALTDKRGRVFEHVELELEVPPVNAGTVENLNAVIREHNQACDEFETRADTARKGLADDMIADGLVKFEDLKNAVEQKKDVLRKAEEKLQGLNDEVSKLEREIVEHRQPAEELNKELREYFGHGELCLKINETGYMVTRGGEKAQSLSEGETTAIALLYFLKSLRDRDFRLAEGVIVLDDPVSSLDANALFLAFAFIQKRTEEAGQVFVLTHNFSFFREVRNWFNYLNRKNKKEAGQHPARFFMLDSTLDGNGRHSTIRRLDPLLEKYDSDYQYLFARVHQSSIELAPQSLEQNYVLPNLARRMLEAFLAFRLPQISGGLSQKLKEVQFDETKKLRILRFLHTHSHSIAVGEPGHDLTALAEGSAVLKDLMEMIKSLDGEHFSAMEQLVDQSANSR